MGPKRNDRPRKGDQFMKQMGLFGPVDNSDDDDDDDLEAELLRLQGGSNQPVRPKTKKMPNINVIQKMADDINLDIGSDEELSGDENELLRELEGLSDASESEEDNTEQPKKVDADPKMLLNTLHQRLALYQAEAGNAAGAKKRRYDRAVKTLNDQIKMAKSGKMIDVEEIPPEIPSSKAAGMSRADAAAGVSKADAAAVDDKNASAKSSPSASQAPVASMAHHSPGAASKPLAQKNESSPMSLLQHRRIQYHQAAVMAKQRGDESTARKFLKIKKDFDKVIDALAAGQDVDLSNIPPEPPEPTLTPDKPTHTAQHAPQQTQQPSQTETVLDSVAEPTSEENKALFNAPEPPKDTLSALEQRLKKYQESEREAKQQSNSGKARRMGRIAKQYQDAIKAFKTGKPVDFAELPTPPGFAEIPLPGSSQSQSSSKAPMQSQNLGAGAMETSESLTTANLEPPQSRKRSPSPSTRNQPSVVKPKTMPKRQASMSIQEKQLHTLKARQDEYKKAALKAKSQNDKQLALKYMSIVKGINPMIQAASSGLPVDMSQVPDPPDAEHETGFVVVEKSEVSEFSMEDRKEEFEKIIIQLNSQIKTASDNAANYKKMGDVKNTLMFDTLEKNCVKDLDAVQNAFKHNDPVPKYHYETREFTIVKVNTDLGDADLELNIMRGVQFPLPSDIKSAQDLDTKVYYELAWPQDDGQKGSTEWAKHSDNPEYGFKARLKIDRRSKSMLRMFKNRKMKFEVYFRRGFLKSDKQLATVNVKLDLLETNATVHDSFNLLDTNGRREIGGKLEIQMRIREPLVQKQVERIKEKWLVIDQLVRLDRPVHLEPKPQQKVPNKRASPIPSSSPSSSASLQIVSVEVLKYEKSELDKKIRQLANQLPPGDLEKLKRKSAEIAMQVGSITDMMRKRQLSELEYLEILNNLDKNYQSAIQSALQTGDQRRSQLLKIKKDILNREIRAWKSKVSLNR